MSGFFGAGGVGGNVERHIGDDDRDGAAIEALQPCGNGMTHAARDVLSERQRQIEVEGWTPEGDAAYRDGELADAAACYARPRYRMGETCPPEWPWAGKWWKPTDRRRNLVKAGALILAEIERLDRWGFGARPDATPPRTGGRRQMKVLIVGGQNRGQVVDVEATPSNMLELVQVRDPVRGEAYWLKVEADVKDKHSYVIGELCRAYEYLMKGETHRQHVKKNGKL
jgi:hypothetical protein